MTLQDDIRADLNDDEGRVRHAYQDHLGFWTIGVGFLIDERKGGGLYDEEIDFILDNRIRRLTAEIEQRWPQYAGYPEKVRRALFSMAYQMGLSGVLAFRNMIAALDAGDYAKAAEEALDSRWAKQTPARAQRMASLIRNP